jgi:GDP-4-dehydro-6-deoxy-D-mannose reductase
VARPFNHIGPRQAPSFFASGFAQQVARIEAGRAAPVLHVGNLDARRDLTDVRDTVAAYLALARQGRAGDVYNVCSGRAYAVREVLDRLLALARVIVSVELDPERLRPSDTPVLVGDPGRLARDTGWAPVIPIERTLADILDEWRRVAADGTAATPPGA